MLQATGHIIHSGLDTPAPRSGAAEAFSSLRSQATRLQLYAVLAVLAFIGTTIITAGRMLTFNTTFNIATADGKDYYVYLPSVLIDHDLDLSNQMVEHYGREFEQRMIDNRTPRGYVADKYPIGVALTLAPPVLLSHAICVPMHRITGWKVFRPDGYALTYQLLVLAWLEFLGYCTLVMWDLLFVRYVCQDGRWVALGISCIALGSPYTFYFFTEPLVAHTSSIFWVTATILLVVRMREDADQNRIAAARVAELSFCVAMALITRPTNVLLFPFLVWLLERILSKHLLPRALALLPLAIVCASPVFLQMWVWHQMIGPWITFSYEQHERFFFGTPRLWQTLISTRNGLFVYSPMLLLATIGLIWQFITSREARRNEFVLCALGSLVIIWYFNSAWWSWWFGDSWGGRAFTEMMIVFAIGMTWLIQHIATLRGDARRAWISAIGGSIIWTCILVVMWYAKWVPRSDYLVPTWRVRDVNLRT